MQRKNYILNSHSSKRNGMAMIMAISVIVIVATIMALALSLTSQTTKRTTDLYLYEQAVLLSHSAAEYGLLQIALNPPCSNVNTSFSEGVYNITLAASYIYYDDPLTVGTNEAQAFCTANGGILYNTVSTPEQNGSVIMDITVDTNVSTEPIRFFRRSIQKL